MEIGPTSDTSVGDIVQVAVTTDGPYGIIFEADPDGCAAVVKSFQKLPSGKFGQVQKHGGVHYGDILFAVNDIQLQTIKHDEALQIINDRNLLKKTFKFMNGAEFAKKKRAALGRVAAPIQEKNSFLSIVRRTRIAEDINNAKYAEYEVACQWRVGSMRVQKEIVYKWSTWKRFSDFDKLHGLMKANLGWQMEVIDLPPTHTFVYNKLSAEFIEQRRDDLNVYWQKIIAVDKVVEFNKHHCSQDLKAFLNVDEAVRNIKDNNSSSGADAGIEDEAAGKAGRAKAGRGAVRRRSSAAMNSSARGPGAAQDVASYSSPPPGTKTPPPPPPAGASSPPAPAPAAPAADPRFEPFAKMLKMGLPEGAVRQKMIATGGFSNSDMDSFLGGGVAPTPPPTRAPLPPPAPGGSGQQSTTPAAPVPAAASLSDPRFEPFAKMLKMGLPEGAVRQKMIATGGFSNSDMDSFLGGGGGAVFAGGGAPTSLPPKASGAKAALFADLARFKKE